MSELQRNAAKLRSIEEFDTSTENIPTIMLQHERTLARLEVKTDFLESAFTSIKDQTQSIPEIKQLVISTNTKLDKYCNKFEKHETDQQLTDKELAKQTVSLKEKTSVIWYFVVVLLAGAIFGRLLLPIFGV